MSASRPHSSVFAFLWSAIRPYRRYFFCLFITPLCSACVWPLFNYSIKEILDRVSDVGTFSRADLLPPLLLMAVSWVLNEVAWRGAEVVQVYLNPLAKRAILARAYDYLQYHDYRFFQNHPTGKLVSKTKDLLAGYDTIVDTIDGGLFSIFLMLFSNTLALWYLNQRVGLLVSGWVLLALTINYYLARRVASLAQDEATKESEVMGTVADRFANMPTILSFGTQKKEYQGLQQDLDGWMKAQQRTLRFLILFFSIVGVLVLGLLMSTLLYSLALREQGCLTVGDLTFITNTLLGLIYQIWNSTGRLAHFIEKIGKLISAFELWKIPHTHPDKVWARPIAITQGAITFDKVHFAHEQPILQGLTFTIRAGEKVGIVGPSGSGKSTLVHLLLNLFPVQKGRITIDGHPLDAFAQTYLRQQIALIPQDTPLFHRTLKENIGYALQGSSEEAITAASKQASLHDFIMGLPEQYDTLVGERGLKLSGGQRQRVTIARAFLKSAPILVLDEATASLDSITEGEIQKGLDQLIQKHTSSTLLVIAHRLSTLRTMDRIIVLNQGRIVESGTHAQLLSHKGYYYEQWKQGTTPSA